MSDLSLTKIICDVTTSEKEWAMFCFKYKFMGLNLCYGCCSVNLLHIFGIPFPKNTFGGLLLFQDNWISPAGDILF